MSDLPQTIELNISYHVYYDLPRGSFLCSDTPEGFDERIIAACALGSDRVTLEPGRIAYRKSLDETEIGRDGISRKLIYEKEETR